MVTERRRHWWHDSGNGDNGMGREDISETEITEPGKWLYLEAVSAYSFSYSNRDLK